MFPSRFKDNSPREILRLLAYHPRVLDSSVLPECMMTYTRRGRSRAKIVHFKPPPIATLGDFNAFPIELLNEILRYSDLYTISMFSLLNRQARTIVHASLPFKHLLHRIPRALVALTRIAGSHFTVDEVFQAFCSPACCICSNFGAFLWIPECIRCCFSCLRMAPELLPIGESDAKAVFRLTNKALRLAKVPIVITLPGYYGLFGKNYIRPYHLLSRARVRQVAIMTHGGEQGLAKHMELSHANATLERQMRNASRVTVDDTSRFMAAIPFPYFDPTLHKMHIGLACQGCWSAPRNSTGSRPSMEQCRALQARQDKMYSEMGFFKHLEHCQEAQDLWCAHQRVIDTGSKSNKYNSPLNFQGYYSCLCNKRLK